MKKNQIIIDNCPNFYKIKNYDFDEDDYITLKLINIYEDFIFDIDENNERDINKIKSLDTILNKYISDYVFRKQIKSDLLGIKVKRGSNIIDVIVDYLINFFESYEDSFTRNIYFARWI